MKRASAIIIGALLVFVAGLATLAWYLAATTGGAERLIALGAGQLPGELSVADVGGSLLKGVTIDRAEYRQDDLEIVARDAVVAIDVGRLMSGVIEVERAASASVKFNDSPMDVDVELDGTLRFEPDWPVDANVEWRDRESPLAGRGRIFGTVKRLEFTHVVDTPEPIEFDGVVTELPDAPKFSARARWDRLTLPKQDFGALSSRNGEAALETTASGYRLRASSALVRNEAQHLSVRLDAHGTTEELILDRLELDGLGGLLTATGSVELGDSPTISLSVSSREFDPGVLLPGYDGRLNVEAAIDAQWPERAAVDVTRLDGEFLGSAVAGTAELRVADGVVQTAAARLQSGSNELRLSVLGRPHLTGDFEINAPDLASLWPGLSGQLRGSGSVSGTGDAPRIVVDLTGDGIAFEGRLLGDLRMSADGRIESHTLDVTLSGGLISTAFVAAGSWDGQVLTERVDHASIRTDIGEWSLREPLIVTAGGDGATVSAHCWDDAPASLCADEIVLSDTELSGGATLSQFPLNTLNPWLGADISLDGNADAKASFERGAQGFSTVIDWKQQDTRILFDSAVEEMIAESEIESRISSLEFQLVADERIANLTGSLAGAFGLTAGVEVRLERPLESDGALSGRVQSEVPDVGALGPVVDRYLVTEDLAGALVVDVTIGGTRDAPTLDGNARLRDGAATVPALGIRIEDVNLDIQPGGEEALMLEGSARSGEGTLELSGMIGLSPETGLFANVAVTGDRFQLIRLPDQTAYISPNLTARFDRGEIAFDGRVLVPEAAFAFRELGDSAVVESDDIVVHWQGAQPDEAPSVSNIRGQLEIELGDAVTFEGLGLETRLTGGLVLTFRPGVDVAGEGSVQLVDGMYRAFGREMLVERGSLNFLGPLDDPLVEARATRRFFYEQRDIKVGINLSGRMSQQLDFVLFSEPAMSEADVLSFLVVGRPSLGEGDNSASGAALAMGLQSLTGSRGTGDKLSLDEVSFEGGAENDTAVAAGKRIGDRWYIRYTYGLFNRVGTFVVRYDIGRGVSVEAGSGAAQSLDLIYSIDR